MIWHNSCGHMGELFFRQSVTASFPPECEGQNLCSNPGQKSNDEVNEVSEDCKIHSIVTLSNFLIRSPDEWLACKMLFHWVTPPPPPSPVRKGEEVHDVIKQGSLSLSALSRVCPAHIQGP